MDHEGLNPSGRVRNANTLRNGRGPAATDVAGYQGHMVLSVHAHDQLHQAACCLLYKRSAVCWCSLVPRQRTTKKQNGSDLITKEERVLRLSRYFGLLF